jgi:hypothetical protein
MYLYIDRLLDSPVPHDMLNEYSAELEASSASRGGGATTSSVPHTIREEPPTPTSPVNAKTAAGDPNSKKVKRTPKDIFRSTETTPLLGRQEGSSGGGGSVDGSNSADEEARVGSNLGDCPKPEIPWLEDGNLDSSDPIVTVAIWVNFAANTILLIGKAIVVAWVPSMSVLASLVDAVLDFLSTAIVFATTTLIARSERDQFRYPVGRRR